MNDELIVQVARAMLRHISVDGDEEWWIEDFRNHPEITLSAVARHTIAAMQPHIAAQREDAARRALKAAVVEVYSECAVAEMIAPIIRAIDPAQFREAGNG